MRKILLFLTVVLLAILVWPKVEIRLPFREEMPGVLYVIKAQSEKPVAIVFHIPGFGFTRQAIEQLHDEIIRIQSSDSHLADTAHVILNPLYQCSYHFFTESPDNKNPEQQLILSTIPQLRQRLNAESTTPLFITGVSSGGWSALYLYLKHADLFRGVWSIAPDPVDFGRFFGIDLYEDKNFYYDSQGKDRFSEAGSGLTMKHYAGVVEGRDKECESDLFAYEKAFGAKLFDRTSGEILKSALPDWKKYDLLKLFLGTQNNKNEIHIIVGQKDEFWLSESAERFCNELKIQNGMSDCKVIPNRGHRNLSYPAPEYPQGLTKKVLTDIESIVNH